MAALADAAQHFAPLARHLARIAARARVLVADADGRELFAREPDAPAIPAAFDRVNAYLDAWGCPTTRLRRAMYDLERKRAGIENVTTARETAGWSACSCGASSWTARSSRSRS